MSFFLFFGCVLYNISFDSIGKYGIKIFWLVDAQTSYPLRGEIYIGSAKPGDRSKGIAHELVMRLSKDYMFLSANITMDNFFTSYKLAKELAEKETTIVGTMRLNKRELPKEFASVKKSTARAANSSVFCFSGECELVSYLNRTKKNVLLLSTAHATEELNAETGKPAIVMDYNASKGGVDTLDKMLRCYSCKRMTARWPMVVFFNMLDIAAFAAFRNFELSHPSWKQKSAEKRKLFLKELAMELAEEHVENRCKNPLQPAAKLAIDLAGFKPKNRPPVALPQIHVNNIRRRCDFCKGTKSSENKTTGVCDHCMKPTCPLHYVRSCENCYLKNYKDPDTVGDDDEDDTVVAALPSESVAGPSAPETTAHASKRRRMSVINL